MCAGIEGFKRDFCSRLWMTYRREFPIMNGSNYTSDCGWGCMIRSGQMLLAEALVRHFLSRTWRWDAESQIHITHDDNMHRKIIRWFGDSSSMNSPFSIHNLVNLGEELGKKAGDWYGPSSVSHLMRFVCLRLLSKYFYFFIFFCGNRTSAKLFYRFAKHTNSLNKFMCPIDFIGYIQL